jgi:hypothetical protein
MSLNMFIFSYICAWSRMIVSFPCFHAVSHLMPMKSWFVHISDSIVGIRRLIFTGVRLFHFFFPDFIT